MHMGTLLMIDSLIARTLHQQFRVGVTHGLLGGLGRPGSQNLRQLARVATSSLAGRDPSSHRRASPGKNPFATTSHQQFRNRHRPPPDNKLRRAVHRRHHNKNNSSTANMGKVHGSLARAGKSRRILPPPSRFVRETDEFSVSRQGQVADSQGSRTRRNRSPDATDSRLTEIEITIGRGPGEEEDAQGPRPQARALHPPLRQRHAHQRKAQGRLPAVPFVVIWFG